MCPSDAPDRHRGCARKRVRSHDLPKAVSDEAALEACGSSPRLAYRPGPPAAPGREGATPRPVGEGRFPPRAPAGGGGNRSRACGVAAPAAALPQAAAGPPRTAGVRSRPARRRPGSRRRSGTAGNRNGRTTRPPGIRRSSPPRASRPSPARPLPARRRPAVRARSGRPAFRYRSGHSQRRWMATRRRAGLPPARPARRSPPACDRRSRTAGRPGQAGRARRSRRAARTSALREARSDPRRSVPGCLERSRGRRSFWSLRLEGRRAAEKVPAKAAVG